MTGSLPIMHRSEFYLGIPKVGATHGIRWVRLLILAVFMQYKRVYQRSTKIFKFIQSQIWLFELISYFDGLLAKFYCKMFVVGQHAIKSRSQCEICQIIETIFTKKTATTQLKILNFYLNYWQISVWHESPSHVLKGQCHEIFDPRFFSLIDYKTFV
jgi:hypothetical protein